jgi:1-acyl-sn-glycerol-3-phosphate acyltransferase
VQFEFVDNNLKEATNTVFILLNQSSFLDSMVTPLLPTRRTLGIINIELGFYPILGWFYLLTNYVIVRQWSNQAKKTLNRTNEFLKSEGNIIISIEGKRSKKLD